MTAPLASTDLTVPEMSLPFSWLATKLLKGSPSSCLIPSEIRSRSTSIESTWASVSSPFLKLRTASSPGSVHDRSERCTRPRSEEHTSELQSPCNLVCRLLLEKKKKQ